MSKQKREKHYDPQGDNTGRSRKKHPVWHKPAILSVEPLEAAAAICEPANAPFGKDFPGTCGTLGS